jgi:hypothetical protein
VLVDPFDYVSSIKVAYRVLKLGGRFIVCNIHPMRMCQPGWIKQGDRKLLYAVDNYTDAGPYEFSWCGRIFVKLQRNILAAQYWGNNSRLGGF